MTILYVCLGLLWLVVIGLCAVVFALTRQIGLLHERIAPVGALMTQAHPEVGTSAPRLEGRHVGGGTLAIGGPLPSGQAQLLFFVSSQCPVCKKLIPIAKSVAQAENLQLIFIGDAPEAEQRAFIKTFALEGYSFINGPEFGMGFQVDNLPYAVLLDDAGKIAARGLVNTREHLESLAVAKLTGYSSAQAYLREAIRSQAAAP